MPTEIFIPGLIFPVDSCCFASAAFQFCRMLCGKVLSPTDDFGGRGNKIVEHGGRDKSGQEIIEIWEVGNRISIYFLLCSLLISLY